MRLSAITLSLVLGVGGCAPVVIRSPAPVAAESAVTGLNPGKVVLLAAGAVSALIVLLLIFEGSNLHD